MKEDSTAKPDSVMVLSAAAATGHLRAADALVSAFEAKGVSARHIEVLRYTNPIFRKIYSDLYVELMTRGPDLLGWLYKTFDRPWQFQKRRLALDRLNTGPLVKLIRQENPDLALCTHFLPAEILLYLRKKEILDIPVGVVVTDFDAHAMWILQDVDWYFVACEETRVYLAALGIPIETIFVTGIPIDLKFGVEKSRREARLRLDLDPDGTTLLVSPGGFGVGPIESLVRTIHEVQHPIQTVVICGRNKRLEDHLKNFSNMRHPMKVIGFTNEMDSWMAASDLLVGKAGGLTSSAALARGLVLVIVNPIPGQEERNSDHFLEEGVGIRCNNLPALAYKIDTLLADRERFLRMQQAVRRMARPNAAPEVVSTVLKSWA
ncbi:MAG TPA: glycosyltransferase [Thermodesulfobacteriota bacterium]|jgi:processive 1,2-diacylglycerol beta-glucosyltransferase|nr:glycosyltransferase [Thermodesulfobacteriota bacterium]